ncbi:MAG TPA: flagellar basal body-associated FliL family protein [Alphaproteobacteria bacterium]
MSDAKHPETDGAMPPVDEIGKSSSKKKFIIIIAIPLLLLAVAGGLYAGGMLPGMKHAAADKAPKGEAKEGEEDSAEESGPSHFYELPDMIVNLTGDNGKQRFLKLSITLELNKAADEKVVEAVLPRVMDHFQTYLRELRIDDLRGSAGIYRLRQELLDRVRSATNGLNIKDVLFEEVLVQ